MIPGGICLIEGCETRQHSRGWCHRHYTRWIRHGHPETTLIGNRTTYYAVHHRLNTTRGPARNHKCTDCDSPAEHWAYDHQDETELTAEIFAQQIVVYSANLEHYQPRCVSCHVRLDQRDRKRDDLGRFLPSTRRAS